MIDWRPRSTGDRDRPLLPRFDVTVVDENRVMLVETRNQWRRRDAAAEPGRCTRLAALDGGSQVLLEAHLGAMKAGNLQPCPWALV